MKSIKLQTIDLCFENKEDVTALQEPNNTMAPHPPQKLECPQVKDGNSHPHAGQGCKQRSAVLLYDDLRQTEAVTTRRTNEIVYTDIRFELTGSSNWDAKFDALQRSAVNKEMNGLICFSDMPVMNLDPGARRAGPDGIPETNSDRGDGSADKNNCFARWAECPKRMLNTCSSIQAHRTVKGESASYKQKGYQIVPSDLTQ
ncbi:hypothetical protein STEG23_036412, partial [Scotinomys teguina]